MTKTMHSEKEEDAFMENLLAGLDDSFRSTEPSSGLRPVHSLAKPRASAGSAPNSPLKLTKTPAAPVTPKRVRPAEETDMAYLLQGAEDWNWDDMSDIGSPKNLNTPKKSPKKAMANIMCTSLPSWEPEACTRCIVLRVDEDCDSGPYQKILAVEVDSTKERRKVELRDDWVEADVRAGDVVNLIGTFAPSASSSSKNSLLSITVSAKHNFFILHPDILLTATALSGAPQCRRKPIVSALTRRSADVTPALVWGNMLHEVVQTCLVEQRWDDGWVAEQIDRVVQGNLGELIRISMNIGQAKIEVKARAKGVKSFAEKYIAQAPRSNAVLRNTRSTQFERSLLAISDLHDIEEDIWSPTYGLKGKIDASVQAVISEVDGDSSPFAKARPQTSTQSWTMPFEIKTGRAGAGMEHRAQTMLYTLLMAERYRADVPSGLLYYTQSDEVVRVPAAHNEMRALLAARNELAGYMMRRMRVPTGKRPLADVGHSKEAADVEDLPETEPFLPPTIDDEWQCGKCYALDTCMLYRKAVENVVDDASPISDIYALKTSHLTAAQSAFFKKWEALISLEEQDIVRLKKELWTMGAEERERHGRCFSSMTLDTSFRAQTLKSASKKEAHIHRFTYRFVKCQGADGSLLNGHMSVGEAITVSVAPGLLALAKGFILELTPHEVVVGVDHELSVDDIAARLRPRAARAGAQTVFRIDKDELFAGMGRIRDNLAQMFYADGDKRRLELVVDLRAPRFDDSDILRKPHSDDIAKLNGNQRAAIAKAINAQDYALILGMPGTGKTTVIAALIAQLVGMGKTILLASYTHSAVDNILLKLKSRPDFGVLRLGNVDKVHPGVRHFTLAHRPTATTLVQLESQLVNPPVVATTCLSIDHPLFARRTFDYCIVDEASQITLPTCLGPLRFADKFVLVGDHFQLPPLVRNREARKHGLEVSLFRRLSEAHPQAVVDLVEQYRMNADIMLLSNKLVYHGRLKCGSDTLASRALVLPNRSFLRNLHVPPVSACKGETCWLSQLLDERCKAVFVDTDNVPAQDSPVGDLVENRVEAHLVYQTTEALLRCGVPQDQIGILSLYRQQIKLLAYLLNDRKDIEILTADRSQGRDKECIIISLVRSNDQKQIGNLLKDWRRMNVSFTRARSKLIVFGSRRTLQNAPLLTEFFELMERNAWIVALPPGADKMHAIPMGGPSHKRLREGSEVKENISSKPVKMGRLSTELLNSRHILRDLVNDIV